MSDTPKLCRKKPGRKPVVTVRMPRELFDRLHLEADEHGTSVNKWCIHKLRQEAPPLELFLILSLKWSRGRDELVWYMPNSRGYTANLDIAGRFTREEAGELVCEGVTSAVDVNVAYDLAERKAVVAPDANELEKLLAEGGL